MHLPQNYHHAEPRMSPRGKEAKSAVLNIEHIFIDKGNSQGLIRRMETLYIMLTKKISLKELLIMHKIC